MKFNYNDGGRKAAGFEGKAGDCVVRAVAIATQQPYLEVFNAMRSINEHTHVRRRRKTRNDSPNKGVWAQYTAFKRYMENLGWKWTPTMGIGTGCKVHLRDGELPMGRLLVSVSRHYCAVVDGVLHDTGDCTRGGTRCVYGYWSKA